MTELIFIENKLRLLCPECFRKGAWCNQSYWRLLLRGWKPVERAAVFWTPPAWTSLWSTLNTAVAAAAAVSLQSCPTLCDPTDGSPPGSPSLGFSRQEHWSGLPFPSPMHESESEVAQSCLILSNLMDCSLLGSSIHGIFQARVLEWGNIAFSIVGSQIIFV